MCGIVGYIGDRVCSEIIFNGLRRMEYRGYDSSGIAVLDQDSLSFVKSPGKLKELETLLPLLPKTATSGIGHTRWATHGPPTTTNAHPHVFDKLALIHNGIIENFNDLKTGLIAGGASFQSETDTEVALMLLNKELQDTNSLCDAIVSLTQKLKGAYSLGVVYTDEPDHLYLVKHGAPLAIGLGKDENFFASDASAFIEHTNKAIFLNDGEFARISKNKIEIWSFDGRVVTPKISELSISADSLEKRGFAHFMLKEIHEQPSVIASTITRLLDRETGEINLNTMGLTNFDFTQIDSITFVACGTAYYSGLVGKYAIETIARVPVNVELASEFRYRKPILNSRSLVVAISQSGETADTLACIKYANQMSSKTFCICNVQYSSIPRECNSVMYMETGPEIGVASTKAFTCMILCQYLLAIAIAQSQNKDFKYPRMITELMSIPSHIDQILANSEVIRELANKYHEYSHFLFIGRGEHYPIALEGALKLKEISYIHAEGYAAGELKHGPIALVDRNMPILALIPKDEYYDKTLSNMEEVRAREGKIIGLGSCKDMNLAKTCTDIIDCPQVESNALQAILSIIPLQIFAYYMAVRRGTDVDQPRNLAKSVTVE